MAIASKQSILGCRDRDTTVVQAGRWGNVRIQSMSAAERVALTKMYGSGVVENEQACDFFGRLVVLSVVDEEGALLFTDEDIPAILNKDWATLESLGREILKFNGIGEDSLKETEKN